MVSSQDVQPVLDLIDSGSAAAERAAAATALVSLNLDEDAWRAAADPLHRLLEDPSLAEHRREVVDALLATPLRSVHEHVEHVAENPDAAGHVEAADALAWISPQHAAELARELVQKLSQDVSLIRRLAELPVESAGVTVADIQVALDVPDLDTRVYAAIAAGRLGQWDALDDVLNRLAAGESPSFMAGDPWTAYDAFAGVRPVPEPLRRRLLDHLAATPDGPRDYRLFVWSVTGTADAEGSPLGHEPAATPSLDRVDPQLTNAVVTTLTRSAFDEHGEPTVASTDLLALRGATPDVAARVVESVVTQAARFEAGPATLAANSAVHIAAHTTTALPLRVTEIVELWQRSPHLPADQVAWVLGRATDDALLDAFRQGIDVSLLRDAVNARDDQAPIHGAGPASGRVSARRTPPVRFIEDMHVAMAEAPEPPTAAAPPSAPPSAPPPPTAPPPPSAPRGTTRRRARTQPAPTTAERHLQVDVADAATGRRREHAFAPGVRHTVAVHIGPRAEHGIAVDTAFPEARVKRERGTAVLDVELVAEAASGTTHERQQLLLPPTGPTAVLPFTLEVAPDATEVRFSVLVFQGVRLLQSAEFEGPVAEEDAPVGERTLGIRSSSELETDPLPVPKSAAVDLSLSFHVGAPSEAMANNAKDGARMVSLGGLSGLTQQIIDALRGALGADDVDGATPGSEQQQTLLRQLAQLGNTLFQQLEAQLGPIRLTHGVQVTNAEDQVVPVEVVYDYGFPADNARLCENWKKALKTGKCSCKRRTGAVRTVCPLGFWGVRLTVERQLSSTGASAGSSAGNRRPDALTLPPLDRVLFAASAKVDGVSPDQRERTLTALKERLGDCCIAADSWSAWSRAIREHSPGLLLALPHNESADNGLPVLQIGKSSTLHVGALTPKYVVHGAPEAAGPVVLLLGCNTAVAEVPWQSAADAFRRHGASVVIGTLAETLGRQTAPMARLLGEALWGPKAVREQTMGEVMRSVRRRLLLQGATLGMSLVAFGHAGWLVPKTRGSR